MRSLFCGSVPLRLAAFLVAGALAQVPKTARAQAGSAPGAPPPGWGAPAGGAPGYTPTAPPPPGYGYPPPAYGAYGYPQAGYPPSTGTSAGGDRTDTEIATLYAFSAGYGVGTGIWLGAELGVDDPGLRFLAPAVLGVGGPIGVFFLDKPPMPRGMPAAIAAGMAIGAGEGVGIASYQYVHASAHDAWGFRGFSRSVFIGSSLGAAAGYVGAVTMEPSPKTSLLVGSSVAWGTIVGSMFGYGGSAAHSEFGAANDSTSLGGLIGYNAGLLGAAALSTVYVPTYQSLTWMWIGFGAGVGLSTPVYLFYAGGNHDPRRGLIFQGTAGLLGLAAGGILSSDVLDTSRADDRRAYASRDGGDADAPSPSETPPLLQITSAAPMGLPGGMGFQVSGTIF